MQVKTSRLGVAAYLAPDGPLTGETISTLEMSVGDARAHGMHDLVIDLRLVSFIDSRGLEYLLDLAFALRQQSGSLRLANPGLICKDVLIITGVDQSIPVFENVESAGGSFL
jgi:anti-anti-sigma factor